MKGYEKICVEITRPSISGNFDVTEKWTYERDNTTEALVELCDVFTKIAICLGYSPETRIGEVEDE